MNTKNTSRAYCPTVYGDVYYWHLGDGPVLLLLHQASQSSEEFAAVAPLLADRYTVLSLDYPGHGHSDDPESELSLPDFSAAIIAVLDELKLDQVHICGHHSGGVIAIDLAVNYSDRIGKVIMSGVGMRTEEGVRMVLDTPMTRDLPIDDAGEFLSKTWQKYRSLSSPGITAAVTFQSFLVGLEARRRPFDAHFAVMHWDRNPVLEKMRKPTLLILPEFDPFVEEPDKLLELIPDSQVIHIQGGGAFLFYEKPADCAAAIIDFIG